MRLPFALFDGSFFEVSSASVMGTAHHQAFRNNQDAYTIGFLESPKLFVAIVADGCTNGNRGANEVGANIAVEAIKRSIFKFALQKPFINTLSHSEFWENVKADHLSHLRQNFSIMRSVEKSERENRKDLEDLIVRFGLFTLNGVVINEEYATFFSIGDGVRATNDKVTLFGKQYNNAPPYLAYSLIREKFNFEENDLEFVVEYFLLDKPKNPDFESLRTFMIGTDGVEDLIKAKDSNIPGKTDKVGELSQFWKNERFFQEPHALQRLLVSINTESITPEVAEVKGKPFPRIKREKGLLPDDTTLIVGRRVYP